MKLLFLSDVHFKGNSVFIDFLVKRYKEYDMIFIVGDLFEFYYGYSFLYKHHLQVIELLEDISRQKKVYLFEGNHEYKLEAIKKFLPNVEIIKDYLSLTINSKLFYIAHGDTIDLKDKAYLLFRKSLKNAFTLKLISYISPVALLKIADNASKFSKKNLKNKQNRKTDLVLENFAASLIKKGYDYVILAHTHNPALKEIDSGVYVNIGDFCEHFSYLEYDKTLKLCYYENT